MRTIPCVFALLTLAGGCGEGAAGRPTAASAAAPKQGEAPVPAHRAPRGTSPAFDGRVVSIGPITSGRVTLPSATVCVPREAAADPHRAFPVLYATDGDYFVRELGICAIVESLVEDGAIAPWVVVGIPNAADRTRFLAREPAELAELILAELEPAVAAVVPLERARDRRAIVGYSYGGLAAVRVAIARPDDVGRVVAMSPSLWFARRAALGAFERMRGPLPSRLYVDVGMNEGDPGEVVPYMLADARELVGIARRRGLRFGREVALREVPGQYHDMAFAGGRLPSALTFTLGERDLSAEAPTSLAFDIAAPRGRAGVRTFAVGATYPSRLLLTWPADLADVRIGERVLDDARIPPSLRGIVRMRVGGVSAQRTLE